MAIGLQPAGQPQIQDNRCKFNNLAAAPAPARAAVSALTRQVLPLFTAWDRNETFRRHSGDRGGAGGRRL